MEKSDKKVYILIIIIIVFFLIGAYKVNKDHIDKSYLVVDNMIKENALKCYLENKCKDTITLKDLFDLGYIKEAIDPITKEDINRNKCIKYVNKEIIFCD